MQRMYLYPLKNNDFCDNFKFYIINMKLDNSFN